MINGTSPSRDPLDDPSLWDDFTFPSFPGLDPAVSEQLVKSIVKDILRDIMNTDWDVD